MRSQNETGEYKEFSNEIYMAELGHPPPKLEDNKVKVQDPLVEVNLGTNSQ